jgi:hypothetical protein
MSRTTWTRRSRAAVLAVTAVLVAACTPAPGGTGTPTAPLSPTGLPPSPTSVAPSASTGTDANAAIGAARDLLDAPAAAVDMDVLREKRPADPVETLILLEGRAEPAIGRGLAHLDFSGMVAIPGATASPGPDSIVELIWTPEDLFARSATRPTEPWETRTRAEARINSGYLGRIPDEVLGLLKLVATSQPDEMTALEVEEIDGVQAQRLLVRVPVEAAVLEGVPAEVPDATVLHNAFGIDALDVEVWLVDGMLRRVRYAMAREKALYGGPDRTTVTYDWSPAPSADPIVVPPQP